MLLYFERLFLVWREEYSGWYFYRYKLKVLRLLTRQLWWDQDSQSRAKWLSRWSTERPLGCCLAPGSFLGCWQAAGDWSGHCILSQSNIQMMKIASFSSHFQWHSGTGLLVLAGGFHSCWTAAQCLAPSSPIEAVWKLAEPALSWSDTEPLAEGPCETYV